MMYLENDKFDFRNVVWVNPVFRGISNEITLSSTRSAITLHRVSSCSDYVVQFRELDNVRVIVVFEEWLGL